MTGIGTAVLPESALALAALTSAQGRTDLTSRIRAAPEG